MGSGRNDPMMIGSIGSIVFSIVFYAVGVGLLYLLWIGYADTRDAKREQDAREWNEKARLRNDSAQLEAYRQRESETREQKRRDSEELEWYRQRERDARGESET